MADITCTGIATEEVFGTLTTSGAIALAAIASTEAFGTASTNGTIALAGIGTTETFGTETVSGNIKPPGIATAAAFGTTSVTGRIGIFGITSKEAFGTPVFLGTPGPGQPYPPYTVYVGATNISDYVRLGGIEINQEVGSRASATIALYSTSGIFPTLAIDDEVVIYDDSLKRLFGGLVETTEEYAYKGRPNADLTVHCLDFGSLCDRRIVAQYVPTWMGNTAAITINTLVNGQYIGTTIVGGGALTGTGIWWAGSGWQPTDVLGDQVFNHITFTEAMNQIMQKVNGDWRVDFNKQLLIFPKSTGYAAAPFTLRDDDNHILTDTSTGKAQFVVSRSRSQYANRIGVRNSQDLYATGSVAYPGVVAGMIIFPSLEILNTPPVVIENSVEKIVVEFAEIGTAVWDYYYIEGGWGVIRKTPTTGGESITVQYPSSRLSYVTWVEDAAEIALYGRFETVHEVKDFPDQNALNAYVAGVLARSKQIPVTVNWSTRTPGLEAGMLMDVLLTRPNLTGTFLIESISSQEVAKSYFVHSVRMSSQQLQRANNPSTFFGSLIQRDKQPVDRILQRIPILLAYDIPGLTNPGLVTGVVPGVGVVEKDGVIREATIHFRSVIDGTPTTTNIIVDIYRNGVSIFGATKLIFPAAATTLRRQWVFTTDPYRVYRGDRITAEVTQADSAAKNGKIDLTILG